MMLTQWRHQAPTHEIPSMLVCTLKEGRLITVGTPIPQGRA